MRPLLWLPPALAVLVLAPAEAGRMELNGHGFTLPDGFTIELAAGTNLVRRPVGASFDRAGRLYVTDSSGSNEKPEEQLKHPDHRVLCLEDTDGDGRFDRSRVFADRVMFPQGCLWHDGWVYVAGPPSIWRFRDADGDGVAEVREEWFKGGTLTGCANDIHGPHAGPDGFLYWTKGAFAEQTHTLGNGRRLQDRAAHILRMRPDGSGLDVVMSGGMDNPVEVAFTPEGEVLFSSTFIDFSQPGWRDGIAYAVQGGVYGKVNDVLDDGRVVRTSPELLHPFVQLGAAAACGLTRYAGDGLGPGFRDNLFATSFNLRKVSRHVLRPQAGGFASTDSDFVLSDNVDFHPTDVLEEADGSLLIVDTGGWYKLCCPSSQLAKADVLGAVYRVRRTGAARVEDPWGAGLPGPATAGEWIRRLADPRPAVQGRAVEALGAGADEAVEALGAFVVSGAPARTRIAGLWALARIGLPAARAANRRALGDPDPQVAQVAAKAAALWRDPAAGPPLAARALDALGQGQVHLARAAVEALGRCGQPLDLAAMVRAVEAVPGLADDPFFTHSWTLACIETADAAALRPLLAAGRPLASRLALVALDQSGPGRLSFADLTPLLGSPDTALRATARWVLGRHPEWGGQLAGWLREQVRSGGTGWTDLLGGLARAEAGQALLAELAGQPGYPEAAAVAALDAMAGASLKEHPAPWSAALVAILQAPGDAARVPAALRAARAARPDPAVQGALRAVARDPARAPALRRAAYGALPPGWEASGEDFAFLAGDPAHPPGREAAEALGRARLEAGQLRRLAEVLQVVGPLEFLRLLPAYDRGGEATLGAALLAALREAKARAALRPELVRQAVRNFPEGTRQEAEALVTALNAQAAAQGERLERLAAELKGVHGDVRRGQAIFLGTKAACFTCHKIGYQGGLFGPDLTSIGQARTERDLLESIIYPSASFVRSYEPMVVVTRSGEEVSGIVRSENDRELVLVSGPGAEQRIPRLDVADQRPGTISLMPAGLDEQLSRQELADLLAFLKNTKWGPN